MRIEGWRAAIVRSGCVVILSEEFETRKDAEATLPELEKLLEFGDYTVVGKLDKRGEGTVLKMLDYPSREGENLGGDR